MTLTDLRALWVLLALLVVTFSDPFSLVYLVVAALPWVIGAAMLAVRRRGEAVAAACNEALSTQGFRILLLVLAGLLGLVVYVFSLSAALFLCTCVATAGLVVAAARGGRALRSFVSHVMMVAVALALVLGVAEIVFRLPALATRFGSPAELAAWDQRYDKLWQRNVFGFRSPYETLARKPHVRRILVLGDSYTWGDKIAKTEDTWPAQLEEALRRQYPGVAFEVINTGQRGNTTANEAELLRRLGWQFDPDLVLVQFVANDGLPSWPNFGRKGEAWLATQYMFPSRFRRGAIASSALLAFLESRVNAVLHAETHTLRLLELYEDGTKEWKEVQAALSEMGESARRRNVPIVLIPFPYPTRGRWTPETYPYRAIHERVGSFAKSAGFEVFDLTATFAAHGGEWAHWQATPYDPHPNAKANALAAQAVLRDLSARPWFSKIAAAN